MDETECCGRPLATKPGFLFGRVARSCVSLTYVEPLPEPAFFPKFVQRYADIEQTSLGSCIGCTNPTLHSGHAVDDIEGH
ncbi:hypothetical protein ACWGTI_28975 [Mesorhizobium sp. ArgA1]